MFKVGEYIIYRRDLCKIKNIERNHITNEDYYSLCLVQDDSLLIKVPVSNKFNHLRYPLSKKQAEELISKIPSIQPINTSEKLLENVYRSFMKTNNHEDLIKIIKTTYLRNKERLSKGKKVGDKDLNFFNQAETLLYNELSYSLGKSYEDVKEYIIKNLTEEKGQKNV